MRTLDQLLSRISFRESRQAKLKAAGVHAAVLNQEVAVTEDLKRQLVHRRLRVLQHFGAMVA